MMPNLKPFDEKSKCPKCGHTKIYASFHDAEVWHTCTAHSYTSHEYQEITRRCKRCRYEWDEAPLDSQLAKEKE